MDNIDCPEAHFINLPGLIWPASNFRQTFALKTAEHLLSFGYNIESHLPNNYSPSPNISAQVSLQNGFRGLFGNLSRIIGYKRGNVG